MQLTGLHLLMTYQCLLECEHCFVWGSPAQRGTMTSTAIVHILEQAKALGSVKWIYFEGGEPFLFYATLLKGVQEAARMSFQVGIVSNGYWATSLQDARQALNPFKGLVQDLAISSDRFHWDAAISRQSECALAAAAELDIPAGLISITGLEDLLACQSMGKLEAGESDVMFRGRAAIKLASLAPQHPWDGFNTCPHEDLREPGRLHLDPAGNLHICQGICIGNLFERPLEQICADYDPQAHQICVPLLAGGQVELIRAYRLPHQDTYADACHLCYEARMALRERFPDLLRPDQIYGVGY
jgi:hypothetical protein